MEGRGSPRPISNDTFHVNSTKHSQVSLVWPFSNLHFNDSSSKNKVLVPCLSIDKKTFP